jgi:hypothetical protein
MNEAGRSTEYLSYQFNGVLGIGREAGWWVMGGSSQCPDGRQSDRNKSDGASAKLPKS